MFKHAWSILCERISIDQSTHLVSYFTCIEGLETKTLPVTLPLLAYGVRLYKDNDSEESIQARLVLVKPDGSEIVLIEGEQKSAAQNHRLNIVLNGITISQSGTHKFRLLQKHEEHWTVINELPLPVKLTVDTAAIK